MPFWDPPIDDEPTPVLKPKHTVTGRVVYNRPWHNFILKDAIRILNKMYISIDDWDVVLKFFLASRRVQKELFDRLLEWVSPELADAKRETVSFIKSTVIQYLEFWRDHLALSVVQRDAANLAIEAVRAI